MVSDTIEGIGGITELDGAPTAPYLLVLLLLALVVEVMLGSDDHLSTDEEACALDSLQFLSRFILPVEGHQAHSLSQLLPPLLQLTPPEWHFLLGLKKSLPFRLFLDPVNPPLLIVFALM